MQLRMWTYDLAREQAPTLDHLRTFMETTRAGGFNAIGLYLEHRFAFPSTPWAHGKGCVTPEMIAQLHAEFPDIQIIPFINLLGHMEGFLYTEEGHTLAEERFSGMQGDPTNPKLVELAERIIDDTLAIFPSSIIHVGGDETMQLGAGERSRRAVAEYEKTPGTDGKAKLYADHFGPLLARVIAAGRRPAIWGDMFFDHPSALDSISKQTLIFDWQYFKGPSHTSKLFRDRGFEVVYCPTLHTYNAAWFHLAQSEENVREHAVSAVRDEVFGVCVTTWECALFGNYETILPAVRASGKMLQKVEAEGADSLAAPDRNYDFEIAANPQYTPEPGDLSLGFGIASAIIQNFLLSGARSGSFLPAADGGVLIEFGGKKSGWLPEEQATSVLRVLRLMANMDPLKQQTHRTGHWKGTLLGREFEVLVSSPASSPSLDWSLNTEPYSNAAEYAKVRTAPHFLAEYANEGHNHADFARLMGIELQEAGGLFQFSGIRSSMKSRMLLYSNPFLFWLRNREDLLGEPGNRALATLEKAISVAPDSGYRGCAEFVRLSIEFVRMAESARVAYAANRPGEATNSLIICRQVFENLIRIAKANNLRIGGSLADIERAMAGLRHVELVIRRVKEVGDGVLGYLPSFETITHPKFMPHDQGNWWLVNSWANE